MFSSFSIHKVLIWPGTDHQESGPEPIRPRRGNPEPKDRGASSACLYLFIV
jgi:hypothetical protein